MKSEYSLEPCFINRKKELSFLKEWIAERPNNILFLYGPKSSGKTTLLYRFISESLPKNTYEIKHFNLREKCIYNYESFIRQFFEIDFSKSKSDIKEKREYDLKVFKLSVETLKGIENKELDPFAVMKKEMEKWNEKGIRPVIIIDELQALEGIYMNGQRELLKEIFNFFVAMTKESHLCHVMIASSDGYFIQRIFDDSKLKKTSKFLTVDYLEKEDVIYWLNNLEKESAITKFVLTDEQIEAVWKYFGGSVWEVFSLLGDLLTVAEAGKIPQEKFDEIINEKMIATRSLFEDYAMPDKKRRQLFAAISYIVPDKQKFKQTDVEKQLEGTTISESILFENLRELVRQNFLSYDSTTAEYALQGHSMEWGLKMFAEQLGN